MLSKKLSSITPSFTIGISTKVNELKSQGVDIINLSIGEPDFFTPTSAKEAAKVAIDENRTKYDAVAGVKEFRQVICKKLKEENLLDYQIDEIVVSSGAKHAISNTLIAITDPGDEILIPKPYWVSYPEMVKLTGGVPTFIDTDKANNFKVTKTDLERSITDKTKAIFITNPSNPTGAIYSKEELVSIVNVCIKNDIYIIADEIYEKICYDGNYTSIASISTEAKDITITINGLAKSAAMTGWRIGYTASNKDLAKAISSIQGHLVSHPCTIAQYAGIEALRSGKEDMDLMLEGYRERRNMAKEMFATMPGVDIVDPDGAFYIFMDLSSIKENFKYDESFSIEVCNRLLEDYKLALVPGVAFGLDDFVRMSYAADINDVRRGIEIIGEFVSANS
ncbi:MAG: pyridoxal phosphate-dependent aminotransferase [Acidaminobacteraceae bacterium]